MVQFAVLNRGVREVKMGLQVGSEDIPTNLYPEIYIALGIPPHGPHFVPQ